MIAHARGLALRYQWVGADAGYGKEPDFLNGLEDMGETFVVDVHRDQRVYLEDPRPAAPSPTSRRGRPPTKLKAAAESLRVDKTATEAAESAWKQLTLRDSTRGPIRVDVLVLPVWTWDGKEKHGRRRRLIVRREHNRRGDLKYSLSNAPDT